ncbi:hypothetical protein [Bacillus cereus]
MPRNGQSIFLHHAMLKQREKTSAGHILFVVVVSYMLGKQNGFI